MEPSRVTLEEAQELFQICMPGIKKEEKENKTASGIVLSTEKKEVPSIASVIAVGDECTSSLKENDRVIYKEYSGTKVTIADQDYIVIDEKDIIAKFE